MKCINYLIFEFVRSDYLFVNTLAMKNFIYIIVFATVVTSCTHKQESIQNMDKMKNNLSEANKKMVVDFYQALFGDKNIAVIDSCIAENYIQHNPSVADGRQALKNAAKKWFAGAPKERIDFQHIGADSNLVYLHTRSRFGNKTFSVVDIFRVENNTIVEHWDVMQEVPDTAANSHPMF
jgi:predicted SnoaL-like aldol condensation-catalyzing enzyme